MQGKYSEAIEELDRSDNTPRESPANNRFTSENLHLAELIHLGKQHDIEDHISQRIKVARTDLKKRLLRKKSPSLRSFSRVVPALILTETQ